MKILTVIGNRPQFVKAAAVSRQLRRVHTEVLVHTGQHYDDDLSTIFIDELRVPAPEHELRLGDGTNTEQTARMLDALGPLVAGEAPDLCSSTATRTRRSPARWPERRPGSRSPMSRPGCARLIAPCPRSSTAC